MGGRKCNGERVGARNATRELRNPHASRRVAGGRGEVGEGGVRWGAGGCMILGRRGCGWRISGRPCLSILSRLSPAQPRPSLTLCGGLERPTAPDYLGERAAQTNTAAGTVPVATRPVGLRQTTGGVGRRATCRSCSGR